jgi:hypothetical protein
MKILIAFPIAAMVLAAAGAPPASPGEDAKPAVNRATAVKPVTIPAGAVQLSPTAYRYFAPDGKTWLYVQSPFGIMRAEQKPAAPDTVERGDESMKATADGDTIRFERQTPFGISRWQKKKSELNEMEQAVWNRESARGGSAQD